MAAGSISWAEFCNQANIFFSKSAQINDRWELKSSPHDEREMYLCKRCHIEVAMDTVEPEINENIPTGQSSTDYDTITNPLQSQAALSDMMINKDMMTEEEVMDDCACLDLRDLSSQRKAICQFEYHIVYSPSYGVPVLYFNAYTPGGSLLSLDTVWNNVPKHYQQQLQPERWTVLTQQEHPIVGRPFFQLHPCHTSDLMKQLDADSIKRNYLVSWLSAVGPVVGLDVPLSYCQT